MNQMTQSLIHATETILLTEKNFSPPTTLQMIIWPLITIILTLWLLPKVKGAFLAFQIFVKDR